MTARRILVSFLFADDRFAQQIDGESDFLPALFAQRFHYVVRFFARR